MEILRRAHRLTCLLLAWFALSVGMAMAAPVIQPHAMDSICTGSGVTTGGPGTGDGHDTDGGGHMKDCSLCGLSGAPPIEVITLSYEAPAQPPAPLVTAPIAAHTAAPLAARGPPSV